jgi:hypothetical protein
MAENKIEEPIGKFIIDNAKGTETQNGVYYHYTEVCTLLNKQKDQLILSDFVWQSKQLVCDKEELDCPYDFTSRCTMGRCDCEIKAS